MFSKRNANTLSTVTLHYLGAVVRTDVLQRTLLSSAQSDNKANVLSAATGLQLCSDNVSYSTNFLLERPLYTTHCQGVDEAIKTIEIIKTVGLQVGIRV